MELGFGAVDKKPRIIQNAALLLKQVKKFKLGFNQDPKKIAGIFIPRRGVFWGL